MEKMSAALLAVSGASTPGLLWTASNRSADESKVSRRILRDVKRKSSKNGLSDLGKSYHEIGSRDNLQETVVFTIKYRENSCKFSRTKEIQGSWQ